MRDRDDAAADVLPPLRPASWSLDVGQGEREIPRIVVDDGAATQAVRVPHERGGARNIGDIILNIVTVGTAVVALVALVVMFGVLVSSSWTAITNFGVGFLTASATGEVPFSPNAAVAGTIYSSFLAILIASPVGLLIAIFLAEMAHGKVGLPLGFLVEFLAAIPSIIYGLWALFVLVPLVAEYVIPPLSQHFGGFFLFSGASSTGYGLLTAALVLSIMIVPTIAAISRDVINAVPSAQREAMLALGATRWEVIWKVVVPYARSGIIGGIVLGLGRAIGETMAVQMVIGNNVIGSGPSILKTTTTIPAILVNQFNDSTGLYRGALLELALALMIVAVILNLAARLLVWTVTRYGT